ncbi:MAG: aminotransferase class IV [Planctomycetota bacterium]
MGVGIPTTVSGPWIWLDGRIVAREAAQVSVLDHGLLYGDSIYETIRTHRGRWLALDEHLERLERSASALSLTIPADRNELVRVLSCVRDAAPDRAREVGARLMVTRGVGPIGLDTTACLAPKLIVIAWQLDTDYEALRRAGVALRISSIRRNDARALNPQIKSGNFLNNILAYQDARKHNAYEAVMLTTGGHVAECTTSNLFWVRSGVLYSASDDGILLGVTRRLVLAVARDHRLPVELGNYLPEHLQAADEIFITSTFKGVLPVVTLDAKAYTIGPTTQRIIALYQGYLDAMLE